MHNIPNCPLCASEHTYSDGTLYICPDCAHEWSSEENASTLNETDSLTVQDSNGNLLKEGDSVILIKDLKVKGSSTNLKKGTKIKNIHLIEGDHNIDCKVDGVSYMLKSCFMKKA